MMSNISGFFNNNTSNEKLFWQWPTGLNHN